MAGRNAARPKSMTRTSPASTSQFRGCQSPWVGTSVAGGVGHARISARSRSTVCAAMRCGPASRPSSFWFSRLLVVRILDGQLPVKPRQQDARLPKDIG